MHMQSVSYQCPNCGAALEYSNEHGKHHCKFCGALFDEEQIKQLFAENEQMKLDTADPEQLTAEQQEIEAFTGASALYTCPNCGAGVICNELQASVRCHFCNTPVILTGRLSGEYKPDMIIPFCTTKEQAKKSFYEYIKGKFLLPRGFRKNAEIRDISALYVPYWMKSGIVHGELKANCKKVRTWRVGDVRYTNTKYYTSIRGGDFTFIRVPCDGSKRIDDALMESIEPFNYNGIKPFSMSYLSRCAAEKYDVTYSDAEYRINNRINEALVETLKADMASQCYTSITIASSDINFRQSTAVYALLPVWFLNYSFKGKDYPFVMNGQTGTHFGKLPVSKIKAALFAAAVFVGVAAIAFGIGTIITM